MVYTSVVQSEDKMRVFIALAVLVCRWWMVCGIGRCPFPGIPANAVALNERNETITWRNRSPFTERQIVKYFCVGLDEAIVNRPVNSAARMTGSGVTRYLVAVSSSQVT